MSLQICMLLFSSLLFLFFFLCDFVQMTHTGGKIWKTFLTIICQMGRFYCSLREISSESFKALKAVVLLFLQNSQQQQHKQVRKWSGGQWRYQWQRLVLWFRKERWAHPVCLSFFPSLPTPRFASKCAPLFYLI